MLDHEYDSFITFFPLFRIRISHNHGFSYTSRQIKKKTGSSLLNVWFSLKEDLVILHLVVGFKGFYILRAFLN